MATQLILRPAAQSDAQILYYWRNHPSTRAVSGSVEPIEFSDHQLWITAFLANPSRFMWMGCTAGQPVGSVRLDPEAGQVHSLIVSIQIDPDLRGKGYGHTILNAACRLARIDLQATRLIAHIRPENLASQRIFAHASFVRQKSGASGGLEIWQRDFAVSPMP